MITRISDDYLSNREWLSDAIKGENVILRKVSALEFMQLFVGYFSEQKIEVYSLKKGEYDNIDYCIVDSFDGIEYIQYKDTMCCSISQAVNDILDDFENADEMALAEALSKYYYTHNKSFEGISVRPENVRQFEYFKDWAINYYEVV